LPRLVNSEYTSAFLAVFPTTDMDGSNANEMAYREHYIPLESNPMVFTQLIHKLGVSTSLAFHDVLSIDDPDLLAFIPRPALALVLVFPTSTAYEEYKAKEEISRDNYISSGEDEHVIWYKQTINNACGLYGILHAVSNGDSRDVISKFSMLLQLIDNLVATRKPMSIIP
jgi:ubiquitin carboxyl-terminal hydrolase L3